MAKRPVFVAHPSAPSCVRRRDVEFKWFPGFSTAQKQRSVAAMHRAAEEIFGIPDVLEVSTKSPEPLGQRLSAFRLNLDVAAHGPVPLECAYQGSKVFASGGPFVDLYSVEPREAKRDARLTTSGPLVCFKFDGVVWPLEPKTAFYDWLYIKAASKSPDLVAAVGQFEAFTDIEYNPDKSVATQAKTCAMMHTLIGTDGLSEAMQSQRDFLRVAFGIEGLPSTRQGELFY